MANHFGFGWASERMYMRLNNLRVDQELKQIPPERYDLLLDVLHGIGSAGVALYATCGFTPDATAVTYEEFEKLLGLSKGYVARKIALLEEPYYQLLDCFFMKREEILETVKAVQRNGLVKRLTYKIRQERRMATRLNRRPLISGTLNVPYANLDALEFAKLVNPMDEMQLLKVMVALADGWIVAMKYETRITEAYIRTQNAYRETFLGTSGSVGAKLCL